MRRNLKTNQTNCRLRRSERREARGGDLPPRNSPTRAKGLQMEPELPPDHLDRLKLVRLLSESKEQLEDAVFAVPPQALQEIG